MSYKTNPILNRIKINKGWKNPYFPTKTLNYARDITLWFKVYLLLKFFLNLKKIQLVSFEIRFDEKNKKILYLQINKKGNRKKKRKKKQLALRKVLNQILTPMLKDKNMGAVFFFYKNLPAFKKYSFWSQNVIQKRIFSKFWLTKPKTLTWLNSLEKVLKIRQKTKNTFLSANRQKNFLPIRHLKFQLYTNKQKQLLSQIAKIKKKHRFLCLQLFSLLQQKNKKILQNVAKNLQKEIWSQKVQIRKLSRIYEFLLSSVKERSAKKKRQFSWKKKILIDRLQKPRLNFFWKNFKKQFHSLHRIGFLKKELPGLLLSLKKKQRKDFFPYKVKFLKKNTILKKILHLNFLMAQISPNAFLLRNSFLLTRFSLKSKIHGQTRKKQSQSRFDLKNLQIYSFLRKNLQKKKKIPLRKAQFTQKLYYNIALWITLRTAKKKKKKSSSFKIFRRKLKKFNKNLSKKAKLKSYNQYTIFLAKSKFLRKAKQKQLVKYIKKTNWSLKRQRVARYYRYRLPYRKMHFNFCQLQTNFQLKYLIQDFVQKYFSVQVETKILHVLNTRKNMNFFRLAFSVRKQKKTLLIKKRRLDIWNQKKIFLASRFKLVTAVKKKQTNKNKHNLLTSTLAKRNTTKLLGKKDLSLLSEKKKLKWRMSNDFSRVTQGREFRSVFKYLIPTLIDFSRSFDPKLLADVLAKVVEKSKKQTWMLNTIKYLLQTLQLPKNVGYKILLSGRINSKKKSRLIYITHKQITLQVFKNNMNFAYAQANARIGAFGVKIWVYSRKN